MTTNTTTNLQFLFIRLKELELEVKETKDEVKSMKTDFHELKELLKQISLQITCNNLGLPSKIESNQLVSIDQKNEAKQMKKLFKKNGGYHKTKTRNNKQEQLLHIRSLSWPTYRDFKQEIKKSQMGIEDKNAIKLQNNTNDDIRYKYLNALLQHEENDNILFFLNKFQLDHEENENKIKKNRKKAIFKNDVHHVRKRKRCLKKSSNNKQYQLNFPPKKINEIGSFHPFHPNSSKTEK
ncbi:hypothetical protein M0813_07533 [Anaeramoeba flamelloides]|uniref:Uncharacterized protein n=1 Tax=Anaeramoeba flamelloides TaxID=1746091 RepID=A0ABQ8XB94_9EUKA|nr:hypothetical protein M0813_07533 [Anaeramoeba flamelloides]